MNLGRSVEVEMSVFRTAKSPKTPERVNDWQVEETLELARRKLERISLKRNRDELVELINRPSSDSIERKQMTLERLQRLGAVPRLAFCRLENFRIIKILGLGSYGKVFLVRLKSHRILPDKLYPTYFPQPLKKSDPAPPAAHRLPEGLSEDSDLCSKYWLPPSEKYPDDDKFKNYFAMKVVPKHMIANQPSDINHIQTELRNLKRMEHPFVIRLVSSFQTRQKVFFVTEYYPGGDLFSLLDQSSCLSENSTRFYLSEIILAIEYLHKNNIIYRDLKPENVVLDLNGHCRLIDFGLSRDNVVPSDNRCKTRCGTLNYMAPEVHFFLGHGRAADFWSLGALAYDMLCFAYPVHNSKYKDPIVFPKHLSDEVVSLLNGLLQKDPLVRLGSLKLAPDGTVISGGVDDVKNHPFFQRIPDWDLVLLKKIKPPWKPGFSCPMDATNFFSDFNVVYPTISFSSKYNIEHVKQRHFEDFNYVNPKFFEGEKEPEVNRETD